MGLVTQSAGCVGLGLPAAEEHAEEWFEQVDSDTSYTSKKKDTIARSQTPPAPLRALLPIGGREKGTLEDP